MGCDTQLISMIPFVSVFSFLACSLINKFNVITLANVPNPIAFVVNEQLCHYSYRSLCGCGWYNRNWTENNERNGQHIKCWTNNNNCILHSNWSDEMKNGDNRVMLCYSNWNSFCSLRFLLFFFWGRRLNRKAMRRLCSEFNAVLASFQWFWPWLRRTVNYLLVERRKSIFI